MGEPECVHLLGCVSTVHYDLGNLTTVTRPPWCLTEGKYRRCSFSIESDVGIIMNKWSLGSLARSEPAGKWTLEVPWTNDAWELYLVLYQCNIHWYAYVSLGPQPISACGSWHVLYLWGPELILFRGMDISRCWKLMRSQMNLKIIKNTYKPDSDPLCWYFLLSFLWIWHGLLTKWR